MVPHLNVLLIAPIAKNNLAALTRQIRQHSPEITILGTANSIEKGRRLIDLHQPNLVFIDVCKPFCEGFELLKMLEPIDFEIIFVNSCSDCPYHHSRYIKMSYIKDPGNAAELKARIAESQAIVFHKAQEQQHFHPVLPVTQKQEETSLRISIKGGHERIDFDEILYLKAEGNYTRIYLKNGDIYMECKILKLIEELLSIQFFFRIDRSSIVNKKHIKTFVNSHKNSFVTMTSGTTLPISIRRKANFILFYEA